MAGGGGCLQWQGSMAQLTIIPNHNTQVYLMPRRVEKKIEILPVRFLCPAYLEHLRCPYESGAVNTGPCQIIHHLPKGAYN